MRVACVLFNCSSPIQKIAELFLEFSPQICTRKDEAVFIEVGKCHKIYSESDFLNQAYKLMASYGYNVSIKIASDITEALCLTKYQKIKIEDLPLNSLVEFADPFDNDSVLQKSVLNMISTFKDLGISTIGDFRSIPIYELVSRFGALGRHCYNRVQLVQNIVWPMWKPESIIFEKKEFSYFEYYGELEPILFELKHQLDLIFARVTARHKRVTKIQVYIQCEKLSIYKNHIRIFNFDFYTPQSDTKSTLRIFKERLSSEFEKNPIQSPIELIETKVIQCVDSTEGQKNLFHNDEDKKESVDSIHNQLIEILGAENVYQAVLIEDRRPEMSWTKQSHSPHVDHYNNQHILSHISDRPTYLFKTPVQIKIVAGYLFIKKRRYRILYWDQNFEKINGGWFEKPNTEIPNTFDRKYSLVIIEGHQKVTIFETLKNTFFLHGYYG